MRDLTLTEYAWISGAEQSDGGASLLVTGTILGVMGGAIGCTVGATNYGSIAGWIGGGAIGVIAGGVGIPLAVIGTGIFIGAIYHSIGLIDINKM